MVGDEIARNPGTHGGRLHRLDRDGPARRAGGRRQGGRARARRQRAGRRDGRRRPRRSPPRRPSTACFLCAGQSCTAGERLLVHRAVREEFVERLAAARRRAARARRPVRGGTTLGPLNNEPVAAKMDEHVADAVERGATARRRRRARASGFPTDLYWPATILDGVPADALVATEETFGPVAPIVAIDSLEQAIELDERLALRAARGDLHARPRRGPALRRLGADGLGERQRVDELLGGPAAVRRPVRHRERHRPRRRRGADGGVHRAADGRALLTYDFVIVGGGSAGCVAREPAERRRLDARARARGGTAGPRCGTSSSTCRPRSRSRSATSCYDWKYESEPEPYMHGRRDLPRARQGARRLELDQRDDLPARQPARLRALGRRRGPREAGTTRTACRTSSAWRPASPAPTTSAAATVRSCSSAGRRRTRSSSAFFDAVQQAGYPLTDDVNGYRQEGFAPFDRNDLPRPAPERRARVPAPGDVAAEPRGALPQRSSTASCSRARGPSASRSLGGKTETIRADEVILCGGAFNSPQLLQLSGVGNARRAVGARRRCRARPARRGREPAGPSRGLRPARVHAAGLGAAGAEEVEAAR